MVLAGSHRESLAMINVEILIAGRWIVAHRDVSEWLALLAQTWHEYREGIAARIVRGA